MRYGENANYQGVPYSLGVESSMARKCNGADNIVSDIMASLKEGRL